MCIAHEQHTSNVHVRCILLAIFKTCVDVYLYMYIHVHDPLYTLYMYMYIHAH